MNSMLQLDQNETKQTGLREFPNGGKLTEYLIQYSSGEHGTHNTSNVLIILKITTDLSVLGEQDTESV